MKFAVILISLTFTSICFKIPTSFGMLRVRDAAANNRFATFTDQPVNKSLSALYNGYLNTLYSECKLKNYNLDKAVFKKAMTGYFNMKTKETSCPVKNIITVIDFKKPSTEKRLWVIDLTEKKVLFHSLVAHGKNSGENFTVNFSNTPNSFMSSLGFYITKNTYQGKHGLSLVLEGLDKDINHNALSRSIVMHGADYVSPEFIKCNGRLGRSQGCPAIPYAVHKEIISAIQEGGLIFIHHTHKNYASELLNTHTAEANYLNHCLIKSQL